jgi:hypothetical protein
MAVLMTTDTDPYWKLILSINEETMQSDPQTKPPKWTSGHGAGYDREMPNGGRQGQEGSGLMRGSVRVVEGRGHRRQAAGESG